MTDKRRDPLYLGGLASATAACFTHPLDLLKIRLQTAKQAGRVRLFPTVVSLLRNEGPFALYNGLSASLLRQMTYSTTRFGVYDWLKPKMTAYWFSSSRTGDAASPATADVNTAEQQLPLLGKILVSGSAGAVGGVVGTPADVVNIRMQANVGKTKIYRNAFHGLLVLAREDGVLSLWRGVGPNVGRAVLMTAGQIATYDQVKQVAVNSFGMRDNLKEHFWPSVLTHFVCSMQAGLVATTICSPVDVIKTRLMNSSGEFPSAMACARQILVNEGPLAFFKGWVPSWVRLGPHTVITFLVLEQLRRVVQVVREKEKKIGTNEPPKQ